MNTVDILFYVLLAGVGFAAGIINILAGGGSNLTLPVLMLMGLPPEIANATNRVGVVAQCIMGVRGFYQRRCFPEGHRNIWPIIGWTLWGGLLGAVLAAYLPSSALKPILLLTMISMSLLILLSPEVIFPAAGTPSKTLSQSPWAAVGLFLAGLYGGFIQAGVGFVLLTVIGGALRYDFRTTTALKVLTSLVFTATALAIFILRDQVQWIPGIVLAMGNLLGARWGVSLTVQLSQRALKWILFIMTLVACLAALIK